MDEPRSSAHWDREVMAALLLTNVQLVAAVLQAGEGDPAGQVMRAIAATRSLDMIVEDTLHALVQQARTAGHTWAEIGDVLHVTRQAAFQRFGGGTATTDEGVSAPIDGAIDAGVTVLEAFLDGRFDDVRAAFGQRMLDACSVELLADVREKVRQYGGDAQALGTPVVSVRDGHTGVDIPVALERADATGRVVLDADRRVAGFFIRPAGGLT